MNATYSYAPSEVRDGNLNQMRFELGDTAVDGEGMSCALCDEEYLAIIEAEDTWTKAKLECLKAIVMKLSYEVDYSADRLSFSLSQRYPRWKEMLDKMQTSGMTPLVSGLGRSGDGGHYFYLGMHDNTGSYGNGRRRP